MKLYVIMHLCPSMWKNIPIKLHSIFEMSLCFPYRLSIKPATVRKHSSEIFSYLKKILSIDIILKNEISKKDFRYF